MIILNKKNYTIYISEKKDKTAREIQGFIYTKQVHGDSIYILDKGLKFIPSENDAIISKIPKKKIGVLLADCNGIVLMGKTWYGVVHAGWKGLENDIIKKTLDIFKKNGENLDLLKVYVGPSIRECCYEVGNEFLDYFDQQYFTRRDGKLYFDMIAVIINMLLDTGIQLENIEINQYCTSCSGNFFSYRKNNNNQRFVVAIEKNKNKKRSSG